MPGPVVHTIIAEQLPKTFEDRGFGQVADTLRANRRALVYGAQGPDPFFFNLNDWLPERVASTIIKWWNLRGRIASAFYEIEEPLIGIQRQLKQEANDTILDAANNSQLVNQIKNLAIKLRETGILFSTVMRGFVKKEVLDKADPFGFYVSPVQTCGEQVPFESDTWRKDHNEWSWFDILHCRQTGDFITELLDIATGETEGYDEQLTQRPQLWSYATGYLSHLAADTVGHAYVNSITGGPYRLQQAQRHTTQEKIMDVWAYNFYYDSSDSNPRNDNVDLDLKTIHEQSRQDQYATKRYYLDDELVNSGMHKNFQFTSGQLEPRQWERDPSKPLNKTPQKPINATLKLPNTIGKNFTTAVDKVYPDAYGPLNVDEVDISYRYWYKFFYGSTTTRSPVHPSELPGNVSISQDIRREWNDLEQAADDVSDVFESDGGSNSNAGSQCFQGSTAEALVQNTLDCLSDAAESVRNFFENLGDAISNLFQEASQMASAVAQCVQDQGMDCTVRVVNYALQKLYEKIFAAYKRLLMLVTALGFSYMYTDSLQHQQFKNFYDPTAVDGLGNTVRDTIVKPGQPETGYPRAGMRMSDTRVGNILDGLSSESHLFVPFDPDLTEEPATIPGPDLYGEEGPEVFITDPNDKLSGATTGSQDPPIEKWIARAARNTGDPSRNGVAPELDDFLAGTTNGSRGKYRQPVLGNAVDLTVKLYEQYDQPVEERKQIPNLNMSGDRAIGFPTWASGSGCSRISRDRWEFWHGDDVPWLNDPINTHVFIPDIRQYY